MKTAEEWQPRIFGIYCVTLPKEAQQAQLNEIKAIQLDAWKQGMTDASEILHKSAYEDNLSPIKCEYIILEIRDKKLLYDSSHSVR